MSNDADLFTPLRKSRRKYKNGGEYSRTIYTATRDRLLSNDIMCSYKIHNPHKPNRSEQCQRIPRKDISGKYLDPLLCDRHSPNPNPQIQLEIEQRKQLKITSDIPKRSKGPIISLITSLDSIVSAVKNLEELTVDPTRNKHLKRRYFDLRNFYATYPEIITKLSKQDPNASLTYVERVRLNDAQREISKQIKKDREEKLHAYLALKAEQVENAKKLAQANIEKLKAREEEKKRILQEKIANEQAEQARIETERARQIALRAQAELARKERELAAAQERDRIQKEREEQFAREQLEIAQERERVALEAQSQREEEERKTREEEARAIALRLEADRIALALEEEQNAKNRELERLRLLEQEANLRSATQNQSLLFDSIYSDYVSILDLKSKLDFLTSRNAIQTGKDEANKFIKHVHETLEDASGNWVFLEQKINPETQNTYLVLTPFLFNGIAEDDQKKQQFISLVENIKQLAMAKKLTLTTLRSLLPTMITDARITLGIKVALILFGYYDDEFIGQLLTSDEMKFATQPATVEEKINHITKWFVQPDKHETKMQKTKLEANTIYERNMNQPVRVYLRFNVLPDKLHGIRPEDNSADWDKANIVPYSLGSDTLGTLVNYPVTIPLGTPESVVGAKTYGPFYSVFPHTMSVGNLDVYRKPPEVAEIFGVKQKNSLDEFVKPNEPMMGVFELAKTGYNITFCTFGVSGSGKTYSLFGKNNMPFDPKNISMLKKLQQNVIESKESKEKKQLSKEEQSNLGIVQLGLQPDKDFTATICCVFELYGQVTNINVADRETTADVHCYQYYGKKLCSEFLQQQKLGLRTTKNDIYGASSIDFTKDNEKEPIRTYLVSIGITSDELSFEGSNLQYLYSVIEYHRKDKKRIKATPNNPESSRGHLFFVVQLTNNDSKKTSYFTLIDMAGAEDPESIAKEYFPNKRFQEVLDPVTKQIKAKGFMTTSESRDMLDPNFKKQFESEFLNDMETKLIDPKYDSFIFQRQARSALKVFKTGELDPEFTSVYQAIFGPTITGNSLKAQLDNFVTQKLKEQVIKAYEIIFEGFFINDSIISLQYFLADVKYKRQQLEQPNRDDSKSPDDLKISKGAVSNPSSNKYTQNGNTYDLMFTGEKGNPYQSGKNSIFMIDTLPTSLFTNRVYPISMYSVLRDLGRLPINLSQPNTSFDANDGYTYNFEKGVYAAPIKFSRENVRMQYMMLTLLRSNQDIDVLKKESRETGRKLTLEFANNFKIKNVDKQPVNENRTFIDVMSGN